MAQKRITSKDLQIAFLIGGLDGVKASFAQGKTPGKKVFNQALSDLDATGIEVTEFAALITTMFPASGKGRGKQQPVAGEIRGYSVQKVKNSAPFIRLPLSILDVAQGQEVKVRFENNKIVVTTR